nr:serine kinase [bacterium]
SGNVWVTTQTHVNIVAVASLKELAAVVIVSGRKPDEETIALAKNKGVCLLGTQMSAYEVAGRMYEAGIRGSPK